MADETPPPTLIALAMHNKHLVSNPDKKLKGVGLSVTGVQPTLDAVDRLFGESQSGVVVLNALHYQGEASAIAVGIARRRHGIKVFILGGGLFARAWAELPIPIGEGDSYRTPSGRRLTTEEAIERCHQFDIRGDQLAQYLHVPSEHVEQVTKQWCVAREPSAMRLPSMRVMGGVLAIVFAVGALIVARITAR
jgi:hypothetical protein